MEQQTKALNQNGREPIDMEIKELVDKAKDLNMRQAKVIKIYTIMAVLFFISFVLSLVKAYQADKAYDQAERALQQYSEGVTKVEELIKLMEERNRTLARMDSIQALADGDN